MTITPLQSDYMNYSYFFKNNYTKGVRRLESILANPAQFEMFINNPAALNAAFNADETQTPVLCKLVYSLGEVKRTAVANAYAKVFGYDNYNDLILSESAPSWQKTAVFTMTFDTANPELTLENFKLTLNMGIVVDSWYGKDIDLGTIINRAGEELEGEFTIIALNHDNLSTGGKAAYTLATKTGETVHKKGVTDTYYWVKFNSSDGNNEPTKGWEVSGLRRELQQYRFEDEELNALVKTVNKVTHNEDPTNNTSTVTTTQETFFIPSTWELFGKTDTDYDNTGTVPPFYSKEGTPYTYFKNDNNNLFRRRDKTSSVYESEYWTRTTCYRFKAEQRTVYCDSERTDGHQISTSWGNAYSGQEDLAIFVCF